VFEDFEMRMFLRPTPYALATALALVAGCSEPLDFDLRGNLGGFSTADAARTVTADRPEPDSLGVISYPNYQVAVARQSDTVTSIANRLGLNPAQLGRFNGIDPNVPLRKGEVIALPQRVAEAQPTVNIEEIASAAIDAAPDTSPVEVTELAPASQPAPTPPVGEEPVRHKVQRGETTFTIARLYNVPVRSLADWNGLGSDFAIREGQYLLIPVVEQRASPAGAAAPGSGTQTPVPPSAATPLPENDVSAEAATPPSVPSVGQPSQQRQAAMDFPVEGKIIRTYSKGRNDGIDIAAAPGTPVRAATDGTVAAITADVDKVPIIVLRHPDNLLTVYANVDKIAVSKDDRVKRGEKLGVLAGGDAAYVHFEVRNGFDSVDPMPYLE